MGCADRNDPFADFRSNRTFVPAMVPNRIFAERMKRESGDSDGSEKSGTVPAAVVPGYISV